MSALFLRNPRLTVLLICLILVSGLSSFFLLPRMEDPKLVERAALVNTIFPGADPSLVESLVTEKIEDELQEIDEIKEIRSSSQESFSAISIELRDDVYEADAVWSKLRDRLDDVTSELPVGAMKPEFVELDFKAFALLTAITWEPATEPNYAILRRWAKQLEDRLRRITGTEKVKSFGQPQEEIQVLLDSRRAAALGLSAEDVSRQIRDSDAKISAGAIRGPETDLLIEVAGEFESVARIEQIPIYRPESNEFVRLGDIARIEKTIAQPRVSIAMVSGKPAITLGALVRPNYRIEYLDRGCPAGAGRIR